MSHPSHRGVGSTGIIIRTDSSYIGIVPPELNQLAVDFLNTRGLQVRPLVQLCACEDRVNVLELGAVEGTKRLPMLSHLHKENILAHVNLIMELLPTEFHSGRKECTYRRPRIRFWYNFVWR